MRQGLQVRIKKVARKGFKGENSRGGTGREFSGYGPARAERLGLRAEPGLRKPKIKCSLYYNNRNYII